MALKHDRGRRFTIRVGMKDEDIITRAAALMGGVKIQFQLYHKHTNYRYVAELSGRRAERLAQLLYPHMGYRRQCQIVEAFSLSHF